MLVSPAKIFYPALSGTLRSWLAYLIPTGYMEINKNWLSCKIHDKAWGSPNGNPHFCLNRIAHNFKFQSSGYSFLIYYLNFPTGKWLMSLMRNIHHNLLRTLFNVWWLMINDGGQNFFVVQEWWVMGGWMGKQRTGMRRHKKWNYFKRFKYHWTHSKIEHMKIHYQMRSLKVPKNSCSDWC